MLTKLTDRERMEDRFGATNAALMGAEARAVGRGVSFAND